MYAHNILQCTYIVKYIFTRMGSSCFIYTGFFLVPAITLLRSVGIKATVTFHIEKILLTRLSRMIALKGNSWHII
jgi:hypothetical protein